MNLVGSTSYGVAMAGAATSQLTQMKTRLSKDLLMDS
jgi:hypothetical protein